MLARTFEKRLQRFDRKFRVRRGLHPQVRRVIRMHGDMAGLNRAPYVSVYRKGDVSGYEYLMYTVQTADGLPREPQDLDVQIICRGGVGDLQKHQTAELERRHNLEQEGDKQAREAKRQKNLAADFSDMAQYALYRDGMDTGRGARVWVDKKGSRPHNAEAL